MSSQNNSGMGIKQF